VTANQIAEATPQLAVLLALGLVDSGKLRNAHAVRFVDSSCVRPRWLLALRGGRSFLTVSPAHAARLELDRLSWVRCGSGWKITKADAEHSAEATE
jgi:hypothetical protein